MKKRIGLFQKKKINFTLNFIYKPQILPANIVTQLPSDGRCASSQDVRKEDV